VDTSLARLFWQTPSQSRLYKQFHDTHNSKCEELFKSRWQQLVHDFFEYEKYLRRLYRSRHVWALVYIYSTFCAGMNSTQRVKSINGVLKAEIGARTTLIKLVESIEKQIENEAKCQRESEYRNQLLSNDYSKYTSGFIEDDYQESRVLLSSMLKL
ncbi:4329_t:CDS:2, partial [Racocetra persica]